MYMLFGMVFTFFFGVILHFVYGWSRNSLLVAFIAPTNESLFEHLKLLMTPFLIWAMVEYAYYGQYMHAFVPGKVIGLWLGFILMIGLHLLYSGLLRRRIVWVDVSIFAVSVFEPHQNTEQSAHDVQLNKAGLVPLWIHQFRFEHLKNSRHQH